MADFLVQGDTGLYFLHNTEQSLTELEIPSDVDVTGSDQPFRFTLFSFPVGTGLCIVGVNGANKDIFIKSNGDILPLSIAAPPIGPTLSAGSSTGLTGVYKVAVTFKVKDENGATIYETALSPSSDASSSLADTDLSVDDIPLSADPNVNARGLYRTTAGGEILYPWLDIDDNTTLTIDRAGADASLSILPTTADRNGAPPTMKLIVNWKDRLWGVPRQTPDYLRWCEERLFYAWPSDNEILIPPANTDNDGITALIPRRDQLGVVRNNRLFQIVGDDNDNFQRLEVSESIGCVSQESVVVIRDVAYWLSERGVVEWSAESVGYVSEAQVDAWFTSDTYFNREVFSKAQGRYNPETDSYELLLAPVGSENLTRWVSFDLKARRWFGPHKTDAFTPTCVGSDFNYRGFVLWGEDDWETPTAIFGGSDGYLYRRDADETDDDDEAVDFEITFPWLHLGEPDLEKYFGELSIHTRIEDGGSATITPYVGSLAATAGTAITHFLTMGRQRLRRLGIGRYLKLVISHSELGRGFRLFGLEFPWHIVGRR